VIEPTDDEIRSLLERARRIAVVGLSSDVTRPSYGVSAYLQRAGYEILPVNPKHAGQTILGQPVVAKVTDLDGPIDIVDIFRRPVDVPRPVDESIAAGAGAIWMQLGIRNDEAGQKAADAGLMIVMNRCISIEHSRLIG
jgi:uncharacterized protein